MLLIDIVKNNNSYRFQKHKISAADVPIHQKMITLIKDITKFNDNIYGVRPIKKVLSTLSFLVSRYKTA
mgnify:CR=1 FL=1